MTYSCTPLSRNEIRAYATKIRSALHLSNVLYFPVVQFLGVLHLIIGDDSFYFDVVADSEWPYPSDRHAYYDLKENCVCIRESIYVGAIDGNGRDRMTITHECAHVLLLRYSRIALFRSFETDIPTYCDPEWQAKCLAGELMIPVDLIQGMSVHNVSKECGVSLSAARYQMSKAPKTEGAIKSRQ